MNKKILFSMVILTSLLAACGRKISSANIKTDSIYFSMVLQKPDAATIECYTRGSVEDELGNSVEFSDGDYLTCNGQQMVKADDWSGHYIYYTTRVPVTSDSRYEIRFYKSNQLFASSQVTIPGPLVVQQPTNGFVIDPHTPIRVNWTQVAGWRSGLSAVAKTAAEDQSQAFQSPETGQMELPLFQKSSSFHASQNIELILRRTTEGDRDPKLKGHIEMVQQVSITGTLLP